MHGDAQLEMPRCVWPAGAELGEGPVWVAGESALYWVDIKGHAIHRLSWPDGEQHTWQIHEQIGAIQPTTDGRFIAALKDGIHIVDLERSSTNAAAKLIENPEIDLPDNRFNDGKIGPDGAFWAGTMDDHETASTGCLYRFSSDGACQNIDSGYVVTNGPAFSPDGSVLYHTDTFKRIIYAFDLGKSGEASNKRVFINIPDDAGYPDGMTVDSEGCLWVCHWGGWRITRYSPEGIAISILEMPVANVTCCAFGGEELKTLFITTASKGLNEEERNKQPEAGGLFVADMDVKGLAGRNFEWSGS